MEGLEADRGERGWSGYRSRRRHRLRECVCVLLVVAWAAERRLSRRTELSGGSGNQAARQDKTTAAWPARRNQHLKLRIIILAGTILTATTTTFFFAQPPWLRAPLPAAVAYPASRHPLRSADYDLPHLLPARCLEEQYLASRLLHHRLPAAKATRAMMFCDRAHRRRYCPK